MESRVLVLGAGFAGLELATTLSEALGEEAGVTLIDANDSFVFGYSKLDVMFGREPAEAVHLHYSEIDKPGVRFARERITAIDPENRTVETDAGTHTAEYLVIALGADYDAAATPGIELGRNEFYSVPGAEYLAGVVPSFAEGNAVIGVCGAPYKCPPAPSEACLLLHDQLVGSGTRSSCSITFVSPLGTPVPPSPATSEALLEAFADRDIEFLGGTRVALQELGFRGGQRNHAPSRRSTKCLQCSAPAPTRSSASRRACGPAVRLRRSRPRRRPPQPAGPDRSSPA